jgi:hypothetical protein
VDSSVLTLHRFVSCSNFSNPSTPERRSYASFWQKKLASNRSDVSFTENVLDDFANETDGFSFAYLKEALYVASDLLFRFLLVSLHSVLWPGSRMTPLCSVTAFPPCSSSLARTRTRRSSDLRSFCWSRSSSFVQVSGRRTSLLTSMRLGPGEFPLLPSSATVRR